MGWFDIIKNIRKKKDTNKLEIKETAADDLNKAALDLTKKLSFSDEEKKERIAGLTLRERDTYFLLINGFTLKEAAEQLGIKYSTVNTYATRIYKKLNVNTRSELIINYRNIQI